MLRYLNTERTEMQFGETFISLPVAGDLGSIGDGPTREAVLSYVEDGGKVTDYQHVSPVVTPDDVNAERDRRLAAGTTVEVDGLGMMALQGRDRDQTNMLGLKDAARDLRDAGVTDAVMVFRDADDVSHDLTPAQMIDMVSEGMAWFSATYQASWAIKALNPIPEDYRDDRWWV